MQIHNAKRNKIVIVLYYYFPYVSGVSVYAKRVAEGLVQAGYEVTVLTSRHDHKLPIEEKINGVHVIRRPVLLKLGKGVIMPTFWLDIIRWARRHDYVNIHLPMAESGLSSLFVPKRKLVTTYHCDLFLGSGLVNRLVERISFLFMHIQLSRSPAIITNTMDYFAHSKMRRHIQKVHAVTPPIDAEEFIPLDTTKLFKRLNIPPNTLKIGFVGRIVYEKGIKYLLDAIPQLKQKLSAFKIIIVGDYKNVAGGSIKKELDYYIDQYPDTIVFTGFLNDRDRNRFYSGLDVFVLPSIDPLESFGIVQVEALLCGSPVVASDLPGVRQPIKMTGFGRIAKIKNHQDLAHQIIEVVTHRQRYKPTREKVAQHFNAQHTIDTYAALMPKD